MDRIFNQWIRTLTDNVYGYDYYTDFEKIYSNVDDIKVPLNILNSLVGAKEIKKKFEDIIQRYPETLKCIPILLAIRRSEIDILDMGNSILYNFSERNMPPQHYSVFMEKTGLFNLLQNRIIQNLVDYVTGVEVGLDSNARKNRGGHVMEKIVESFIQDAGFQLKTQNLPIKHYCTEMTISKIKEYLNIDMSSVSNNGTTEKRFDFVVRTKHKLYVFETNFYSGGGSKLNETARSYKTLANEINLLSNVEFVWITDGSGWRSAKNNLRETFDVCKNLYNINDLKSGILKTILI